MSVNKVILIGRVGKDPEMHKTESLTIGNLTLATNEKYTNKQGEKIEETEWHNLVFFRKLAEIVESYVKKGSQIYIEGKIKTEKFEKDGTTKYFTKIIVDKMQMLGGKSEAAPTQTQQSQVQEEPQDDLPF